MKTDLALDAERQANSLKYAKEKLQGMLYSTAVLLKQKAENLEEWDLEEAINGKSSYIPLNTLGVLQFTGVEIDRLCGELQVKLDWARNLARLAKENEA